MKSWHFLLLLSVIGFSAWVRSEPWMASRFAQNCASCHAPGRVNVPAKERRCSLSCQGCHTNPSGGGLRNFYGKWTEERWLRSMYVDGYKLNKPRPNVTAQQWYEEKRLKAFIDGAKDKKELQHARAEGFKLRETYAELPESEYDRRTTGEHVVVPDMALAEMHIPQNDPWRQRRENYFNGGIDFRWFDIDDKLNDVHQKGTYPMSTDVAVSVEPVHKLNLVWEGRFLNDPRTSTVWDDSYTSASSVRSAYAMVDDLPYNTFVQYGIYRPLFGHYNPDHTSLFAKASGLDQRAIFKAASIGTAPNVPFFNLHYIQPFSNHSLNQEKGLAFNAGARFVTLGAYMMFSYWNTTAKDWISSPSHDTKKTMLSLTGGFTKGPLTVVADVTKITKDQQDLRKDSGSVITLEPRFRVFKESYIKGSYETLNTARTLQEGKANQIALGVGSFIVSGVEVEIMYKALKATENSADVDEKITWLQTHFFF